MELKEQLGERGYRMTRPRQAILDVLRATCCHPDANWVYDEVRKTIPHISLATVYRTLDVLAQAGLVRQFHCHGGQARYDDASQPHYHVVCQRCGQVADVPMPSQAALEAEAARSTSYAIAGHHIEFYGLCQACRERDPASPAGRPEQEIARESL